MSAQSRASLEGGPNTSEELPFPIVYHFAKHSFQRKGVFITTSSFTPQAIAFAKTVDGIVLIDGPHLAELMIDHETGVTLRPVKVPKVDSDYFDE